MTNIPESCQGSAALQLIISRGWEWRVGTLPNIELERCPFCLKTSYGKFYIEAHGTLSEHKNRDGLFICHHGSCNRSGNLYTLKQHLGLVIPGVESRKDWSGGERKVDPLPDVDALHEALLADEDAMDYLINGRGFSREIIQRQKLGVKEKHFFRETGEVRALVYPYLVNGNCVWSHFRTLPTMPLSENKVTKAFSSPAGWDAVLYNGDLLREGLKEVIMVEGEPNVIAALDHGIENIVGVPGANIKKAEWIDTLDKLDPKVYICYDRDKAGSKAAQALASRIGIERCWKITLPDFTVTTEEGLVRAGKDLNEWFVSGGGTANKFEQLKSDAVLFDVDGVSSSGDAVQEFLDELVGKGTIEAKYKSQWGSFNNLVRFNEGDVIDILAPEKVGKFLSIDSKILLSDGTWKRNGDLAVGDSLASVDGNPNYVTHVFPQGVKNLFKVTFADGRSTLAGAPHLWKVQHVNEWGHGWRIYTTDAIAQEYQGAGNRKSRVYVPLISGDFGTSDLPIDPWLLGVLIGDGGLTNCTPRLTTVDLEIVQRCSDIVSQYKLSINPIGISRKRLSNGHIDHPSRAVKEFSLSTINWAGKKDSVENYVTNQLRLLGLHGHSAASKFIPELYLRASKEDRWELLRGLMDTDGTAGNKHGATSYCTISKRLADDVQYLVRSLGGIAQYGKAQKKQFRYKGELRTGQPAYIVNIRMPDRENLFTLPRKLARVHKRKNQPRLTIESIEPAGEHEALCISVSHPSQLYVTDDFIVTHNTTTGLNLIEHMVDSYGDNGLVMCLEMTKPQMARKWISYIAQIDDNIPKTPEEAKALTDKFVEAIPKVQNMAANREGDLYFCYPKYKTVDDIYKLIRECIRRYGVKWVMLDNLQRLCDTTLGSKGRTQHLSEISKVTSQIAKDYNIQMIRILQPHRIGEGKMVTTDSVDGASQIAKDCDCMITLHRKRIDGGSKEEFESVKYVEGEGTFENEMKVTVGLSRYSTGGYTTLYYDGAKSTVREVSSVHKAKVLAAANQNVGYENQLKALNLSLKPDVQPDVQEVSDVEITI